MRKTTSASNRMGDREPVRHLKPRVKNTGPPLLRPCTKQALFYIPHLEPRHEREEAKREKKRTKEAPHKKQKKAIAPQQAQGAADAAAAYVPPLEASAI